MKKITQLIIAVGVLFFLPAVNCAQINNSNYLHIDYNTQQKLNSVQHFFDTDSLTGFNEFLSHHNITLTEDLNWEKQLYVSYLKRRYINSKYNLRSLSQSNPIPQSPCTNVDFETGTIAGWTLEEGTNSNSLTHAGCCPNATALYSIVAPGFDPSVPVLATVPPGGGNWSLKIGDGATAGAMVVRAKQTFAVSAANSVFIYKFAVVLEDGSHSCTDQPYFSISFTDASNNSIPCGSYNVVQGGSGCSAGADPSFVVSGAYAYKDWTTRSFDLTNYIGQNVTVEFIAGDCTQGGHSGWAYVDCSCNPMTLNLNGNDIPVGQTTTNMCSTSTNTLCAPQGFTSYTWTGPGVTGNTNQCIQTNASGTYSVSMGMQGLSCVNPVLYSSFNLVPKPISNFTFSSTPCQNTFTVPFTNNCNLNGGPSITNYYWDFNNDGITDDSSPNPINTYSTSGTYSVQLMVSNGGCTDSITKVVTIIPGINSDFSVNNSCLNQLSTFTDLSLPTTGLASYVWNYGDGSAIGSGVSSNHLYTSSGIKNVTHTVTSIYGCQSIITKTVNIYPTPLVSLSSNTVCLGLPTVFVNNSTVTLPDYITHWQWDFENNGIVDDSIQSPIFTYTNSGVYLTVLTATTNNGCVNTSSISAIVNVVPTASFSPVNACINSNVQLNNTSYILLPSNIVSYDWNFDSGSNITNTNVSNPTSLSYSTSGTKNITLTVMANNTCTSSITQSVVVYPQPVANFSSTSVCQLLPTDFTNLSLNTTPIVSYGWDYTSNGTIDGNGIQSSYIYPSSGTYSASLYVTDIKGCKDTLTLPVEVWGHSVVDFISSNECYGSVTGFTNTTNTTLNSNVGIGTSYLWNFGDGTNTTSSVSPIHTYTLGGNVNSVYNVTLTTTSAHNCKDSVVKPVRVYSNPTAIFVSDSVCLGTASHLTDLSTGNGNPITNYSWDFLSDGTIDATGVATPNYVFPSYGNNVVSYTVTSTPTLGLLCRSVTNTISVWVNPNPVVDFTYVNRCINAQPTSFDGSNSTIGIGSNSLYTWSYGNGVVSASTSSSTSTYSYSNSGLYNVTLTVTSNKGCSKSLTKSVEVYPKPFVMVGNSSTCDGTAMTFTSITLPNSGNISNWYWDLDNVLSGIESLGQTTSYVFPTAGSHTLHLVTETNHGCRDTLTKRVYVNYNPTALFTVDDADGCSKHCVSFSDAGSSVINPSHITQWQWFLGDGTNVLHTTNMNIQHCYINTSSNQVAEFDIKLIVTTDSGCVNVNNKINYITVYPKPIANYNASPNPGNITTPLVYFTNQSIDYTKWWWSFGEGGYNTDSVNNNPTHFYNSVTAQTYGTHLIVMNQYGCRDTAYVLIDIRPEYSFYIPNAFTPSNTDGVNDTFKGMGIGISKYELWIYNRWGDMIFYSDDIAKGWDGKVEGKDKESKQDVYAWKVKIVDVLGEKHEYVGHVTLLN